MAATAAAVVAVAATATTTMMMRQNERSKVKREHVVYPASLVVNTSVSCIYDADQ